jgi:RHS repeat-associated protein
MRRWFVLAALLASAAPDFTWGQAAGDNPTGPAGIFDPNGVISTGCAISPYTANAMRSIMDISIAGSVGTEPLALIRTANSRNPSPGSSRFGYPGGWQHNYAWALSSGEQSTVANFTPTKYPVYFPDGRTEVFSYNAGDPYFRAGKGVPDRFIPISPGNGNFVGYLVLADGSKVEFKATPQSYSDKLDNGQSVTYYTYRYVPQAIIDRHNLRTNLTVNSDGVTQVTDASGRYLQFTYVTTAWNNWTTYPDRVLDHVTASDGRVVKYTYQLLSFPPSNKAYTCLTGVNYYGDNQLNASYGYQGSNVPDGVYGGIYYNAVPLLKTASDPMYSGPMWKIGYTYATDKNPDNTAPVYGQIKSENYFNGSSIGGPVSTLTINGSARTETRGDNKTRAFTYGGTYGTTTYPANLLTKATDFKGLPALQGYDLNTNYVTSVTDRNSHTTNYTLNSLTGKPTVIQFPATPNDSSSSAAGKITYTYGSSGCADQNNRDANNPYYVCAASDEAGHVTQYYRDGNHRVTQINYPDSSLEKFSYTPWGEVFQHQMRTGGTEAFVYDGRGLKTQYRDAYHDPAGLSGNPTFWYNYDSLDRISGITDTLGSGPLDTNHCTNYEYNSRGQVTRVWPPFNPDDGIRHNVDYNIDVTTGTLTSVNNSGDITSYAYDDYRRVRSVTTPVRGSGDNSNNTTQLFYDANGTGENYATTPATVTWRTSPAGERTQTVYDPNLRKNWTVVAVGTTDQATTSVAYDNVGNVTVVATPNEQNGQQFANLTTKTSYDERNRIYQVTDSLSNTTTFKYDSGGRKASVLRPNGQFITYDTYDQMNRLLQQTVTQSPEPSAVTKYTYDPTGGQLQTMTDPNGDTYTYGYDLMNRKISLAYPVDSSGVARSEGWQYDMAGRMYQYTNRAGNILTLTYDQLYRVTLTNWNDAVTPDVTMKYDSKLRLIEIDNSNAAISRTYYGDDLLNTETVKYGDGVARTITYTYDADGRRASLQYPNGAYTFNYTYTKRSQLDTITNNATGSVVANYGYDPNGNLTNRILDNSTSSTYGYNAMNRALSISHALTGTTRTFAYDYDSVGNRKWVKRDGNLGDAYGYDQADQVTFTKLNTANADGVITSSPNIIYDANGNRTSFSAYSPTDNYTVNHLNQYTNRTSATTSAVYDTKGNMTTGLDGSIYTYDAQNRLLTAKKGTGPLNTFTYDGLNRQVSRKVGGGGIFYRVYDGWDLLGEYASGSTAAYWAYLYGAGGLVKNVKTNNYYYQDASGSTTHLASNTGVLRESYRYDLHGQPIFYNASDQQVSDTAYGVRHLFTGQQWYNEIGLYDLRNRYYSPDIGRFLQADPADFEGDATNLYRYCGNNPISGGDPFGLWTIQLGLSFSGQIGPLAGSVGFGVVFDGHGNVGGYSSSFVGATGVGAAVSAGGGGMYSNADTIYGVAGPFIEGTLTGGDEEAVSVGGFGSPDGKVVGYGLFGGVGGGAGATVGVSNTNVRGFFNIFGNSVPSQALSPNATGSVQSSPGETSSTITDGRVIVSASPIQPGDPTNGNAFIRDTSWGGYYTSTGSTTLSHSFDWGNSTNHPTITNPGGGWQPNPHGSEGGPEGDAKHHIGAAWWYGGAGGKGAAGKWHGHNQ